MPNDSDPGIPGFVPGVYGRVNTGVGGQNAASLPKSVLVVGLATGGTIAPDTGVVSIQSPSDADTYAGLSSEGACMLYDELKVAAPLGVPVYYCSPTPAAGATQATTNIKFAGTATATGQIGVRIGGKAITLVIPSGQTAPQAATALASVVAGYLSGRSPITASAATSYCTLSCVTPGVRGMQHVVFLDVSLMPAGLTATLYVTWTASQTWVVGDQIVPSVANGFYYKCTTAGTGTGSTPTWPTTVGTTVTDGTAVWTCWGSTATGNLPTTAVFLGNATGLETYTNLLNTLTSQAYDRIVLACNDAVSIAAWKTQIDTLAGPPSNFLQQVVVASNGTEAAAQSLAQTTVNDSRFEWLWQLNGETHPSRVAANFGGLRASAEQSDPNAGYDGVAIPNVAAQSQKADWPGLPTLITCLYNGVTPVTSGPFGLGPGGDGYARVVRAITTKCLTGGFADYSTIDVGMQTVPDFVFRDGSLLYSSKIQPANSAVAPDPPANQRRLKAGIWTPSRAKSALNKKLTDYSNGILSSTPAAGAATITPIILPPLPGDVVTSFVQQGAGGYILATETVRVMPKNHNLGFIVNQSP